MYGCSGAPGTDGAFSTVVTRSGGDPQIALLFANASSSLNVPGDRGLLPQLPAPGDTSISPFAPSITNKVGLVLDFATHGLNRRTSCCARYRFICTFLYGAWSNCCAFEGPVRVMSSSLLGSVRHMWSCAKSGSEWNQQVKVKENTGALYMELSSGPFETMKDKGQPIVWFPPLLSPCNLFMR